MDSRPLIFVGEGDPDWPDNWETLLLDRMGYWESNLVVYAKRLQTRAIDILTRHRHADGDAAAVNLGVVVRVRQDTLGPRIHWVRFRGKARYLTGGDKFVPTETIRMQGRYRYSARIFAAFPERTQPALMAVEDEFAWVRFRTERLAALRDLCRKTASASY